MGMDVYGTNGGYFRRNIWGWLPLVELCHTLAPETTAHCQNWYDNNGHGLTRHHAATLAATLYRCLADGTVDTYIADRNHRLAALPDECCPACLGTGKPTLSDTRRADPSTAQLLETLSAILTKDGHEGLAHHARSQGWSFDPVTGAVNIDTSNADTCLSCLGTGKVRPAATWYQLERQDVVEFADFLRDCGGFRIC